MYACACARTESAAAVSAFHGRQPSDDVYFRYFTAMPTLTPRMVDRLTNVDYVDRMGFVAELGDERVCGHDAFAAALAFGDPQRAV